MKYENEEQIRKDFARLFGWRKERSPYDHTAEYRVPEWSEIFAQVGKLLTMKDEKVVDSKIDIIFDRLNELELNRDKK